MKTKQNLELKIGQVEIDPNQLMLEGEKENYLWDRHKRKLEYSQNDKNHRFVLHHDEDNQISLYIANDCKEPSEVTEKFNLDEEKIIGHGRLYPKKPLSLDTIVIGHELIHFIPLEVKRSYAKLLSTILNQNGIPNKEIKSKHRVYGNIHPFWIDRGFLPSDVRENKYTIEHAKEIIDSILDRVEQKFFSQYKRFPSLFLEEDYLKLGKIININSESRKYKNLELNFDSQKNISSSYIHYSIASEDIGLQLIKRFLQRQEVFEQLGEYKEIFFEGLFGRVGYRVPQREYEFRARKLEKLVESKVEISGEIWDNLNNGLEIIKKRCFLPRIHQSVYNKPEGKKTRFGYENIGTHIVNGVPYPFDSKNLQKIIDEYREGQGYKVIGNKTEGYYL